MFPGEGPNVAGGHTLIGEQENVDVVELIIIQIIENRS